MSNGGMIQLLQSDGEWRDCFPVGYKPETAARNVARKYGTEARVVRKDGTVIFTVRPS